MWMLEHITLLQIVFKIFSCLSINTLHLHYQDNPANADCESKDCVLSESYNDTPDPSDSLYWIKCNYVYVLIVLSQLSSANLLYSEDFLRDIQHGEKLETADLDKLFKMCMFRENNNRKWQWIYSLSTYK
jgi:hypothetical protein